MTTKIISFNDESKNNSSLIRIIKQKIYDKESVLDTDIRFTEWCKTQPWPPPHEPGFYRVKIKGQGDNWNIGDIIDVDGDMCMGIPWCEQHISFESVAEWGAKIDMERKD